MIKLNEKSWLIVLAAVCLVYISLRFWHLTDSCLWFDEIFSVHAAEHDWFSLFSFVALDLIHPPLFYVFLKLWISIGGESLFWLRFSSVLFSIIALIPFYLLCRQLKLKYPAVALALIIFAVNGYLVKYAQEVRMYSLLLCLSLFSIWLFARFLNVGKGIWFLTVVNILLVYTQYFGWFVVVAEVFAGLFLQRIKIRRILTMFGLTVLSFIAWIIAVASAAQSNADVSQNLGWASRPNLLTLIQFGFNLNEPFYYQASNIDAMSIWIITIPLLLLIVAAVIFYFVNWNKQSDIEKNAFYFLLILITTPILLAFLASWVLPFSIWGTRHFIIVFAPYAILLAVAFNKIQIKPLKIILLAAVAALFGMAFYLQIQRGTQPFIWCAWENFASQLPRQNSAEPTKIFVFEDDAAYLFWFALRNEDKNFQIVKVNGISELKEDKAYFLPRGFDLVQTTDTNGLNGDKFFVVFRAKEFNYLEQPLRTLIDKGYRIGEPRVFQAQALKVFLVEAEKKR